MTQTTNNYIALQVIDNDFNRANYPQLINKLYYADEELPPYVQVTVIQDEQDIILIRADLNTLDTACNNIIEFQESLDNEHELLEDLRDKLSEVQYLITEIQQQEGWI